MNESNPSWLQRNAFVVAAAALPAVVVAFFLAATIIPEWTVDDPMHDVIFAQQRSEYLSADIALEFKVSNGRVMAVARRLPQNSYGAHQQLFRYHVRTGQLEELQVDVPEDVRLRLMDGPLVAGEAPPDETFDPQLFAATTLSTQVTAPDGYEFIHQNSGHRGLFGELFGMGRRHSRLGISKGGRLVPFEAPAGHDPWRYYSAVLLAWVEEPSS